MYLLVEAEVHSTLTLGKASLDLGPSGLIYSYYWIFLKLK